MKSTYFFATMLIAAISGCGSIGNKETEKKDTTAYKLCAPMSKTDDKAWYASGKKAPVFSGLEGVNFPITTSSEEAQKYFNQGMMLAYGFNHAEAARSFFESMRLDSNCAMCHWGFAYVLGPNYNAGMEEDNIERAFEAIQKAVQLSDNTTPKEQALINAMSKRYSAENVEDRSAFDKAYSDAMREVHLQFSDDADIAVIFAESLMDMHPWDLHDKEGKPKEWTPEIILTLEKVMKMSPRHAGAHHFYIHAVEASSTPQRALPSADLLLSLVPGAGHLVHMPSHIYIRTGKYHEGTLANIKASQCDSQYIAACHAQGAYPLVYFPHTIHFIAATSTLEGNSKMAIEAARSVSNHIDTSLIDAPFWGPIMQHFYSIPKYVAVKFALWDDILNSNEPNDYPYVQGIHHYARGMAFLGKKQSGEAEKSLAELKKITADTSLKNILIWESNSVQHVLQIAEKVLEGEIKSFQGKYDEAITLLNEGVKLEDQLNYNEPPDWIFPVRHYLGAVLLQTGKYAQAQNVFQEDLKTFPENGWALSGLLAALEKQGKTKEAAAVKILLEKSWKHADVMIKDSKVVRTAS
jgi:tetratricopeptide (TPR) repeat protein